MYLLYVCIILYYIILYKNLFISDMLKVKIETSFYNFICEASSGVRTRHLMETESNVQTTVPARHSLVAL